MSDGLLVAMVLKGLPPQFKSFVAVITQSDKNWTFRELKLHYVIMRIQKMPGVVMIRIHKL